MRLIGYVPRLLPLHPGDRVRALAHLWMGLRAEPVAGGEHAVQGKCVPFRFAGVRLPC